MTQPPDPVRRKIQNRWHNLKRKTDKDPKIRLCRAWYQSFERFLTEVQALPGFDEDALTRGELTLIRIGSVVFSPKTALWIPSLSKTISGKSRFLIGQHAQDTPIVVLNEEAFADEMLETTYHVLRRAALEQPHHSDLGEWTFSFQRLNRNNLAVKFKTNQVYV